MNIPQNKVIVIAGPTASGKKLAALAVAEAFEGEIISADSRKIYRYLDIGTAKPSPEYRKRIPHHLIDILDPDEDYSAGQFAVDAERIVGEIKSRQKLPIICGGAGFYIKALMEGLSPLIDSWPEKRRELLEEYKSYGISPLLRRLEEKDPERAQSIPPGNVRRILRSLEIVEMSGFTFSQLTAMKGRVTAGETHERSGGENTCIKYLYLCLRRDRKALAERIRRRTDEMFNRGLLAELEGVLAMGFDRRLNALNTVGYRELFDVLSGLKKEQEARDEVTIHTRQYAKRQMTWFKAQHSIGWIDMVEDKEEPLEEIFRLVRNFIE